MIYMGLSDVPNISSTFNKNVGRKVDMPPSTQQYLGYTQAQMLEITGYSTIIKLADPLQEGAVLIKPGNEKYKNGDTIPPRHNKRFLFQALRV